MPRFYAPACRAGRVPSRAFPKKHQIETITTDPVMTTNNWFTEARYGLFIHYGLYSLLERGEWVWNREEIPLEEYKQLAARFTAKDFDADRLCLS